MLHTRFHIAVLNLLLVSLFTFATVPVFAQDDQAPKKDLTTNQILNIFLPADGLEGGIQLVDGVAEEYAADSSEVVSYYEVKDPIALGDLNGDDHGDGVMVLSVLPVDGSGVFYSIHVILYVDGEAQRVAFDVLGDRIRVVNLAIRNQQIVVDMVTRGEDDPECCHTNVVRRVYEYTASGEFNLVDEISAAEAELPYAADDELTYEELANLTYPETIERFSIDLVDGAYEYTSGDNTLAYELMDNIVYGDLTSDGLDDAVVFIQYYFNGEPAIIHMYVVMNRFGLPQIAGWRDYSRAGDVEINNVTIEDQVLTVDFRDVVHDNELQENMKIEMEQLVTIVPAE